MLALTQACSALGPLLTERSETLYGTVHVASSGIALRACSEQVRLARHDVTVPVQSFNEEGSVVATQKKS
jgi:hypothetical protein